MKRKSSVSYKKYIYWFTEAEENRLRDQLALRNIKLKAAKGVVCSPLDSFNKISSVSPGVWSETCARQGSWYRNSEKNGLYLVVSSFELTDYRDHQCAIISESDFLPPKLATWEEKEVLLDVSSFKEKVPDEWQQVDENQKNLYLRWAKRLGSDVGDFDFLFVTHTANHANFISPRFFISEKGGMIPYSIDKSAHVCSCCLELFQILGGEYSKKLVVPCAGATIFARLKPDQFLLVEKAE